MAKYPLTEEQKNLLRSIAPGLRDGTVETEWIIFTGRSGIEGIEGISDDGNLWTDVWKGVRLSDLGDFVTCGLFREMRKDKYNIPSHFQLNKSLILTAVEDDFEIHQWFAKNQHSQINVSGNITGSNVNIASTLTSTTQIVNAASSFDETTKAQLVKFSESQIY